MDLMLIKPEIMRGRFPYLEEVEDKEEQFT